MIGATMIESERRGRVSVRSAVELLNAAYALHPAFGEAEIVELGADVRPAFPDNLPRVRRAAHVAARQRPLPPRLPAGAGAGPQGGRDAVLDDAIQSEVDGCRSSSTATAHDVEPGTLAAALNALGFGGAQDRDRGERPLRRRAGARPKTELADGDRIEVVAPMQGG